MNLFTGKHRIKIFAFCVLTLFSLPASAVTIQIQISGEVEFNQIGIGPLQNAMSGDTAELVLLVDSDIFTDSSNFPVRGYEIQNFTFTAGGNTVALANPTPGGVVPYFIIRNDDPAVDGFFTGTNIDGFPNGIPSDSMGAFDAFSPNFSVAYDQDPLSSLNILEALGTYNFSGGLTSFNFVVNDGPFDAMGLIFERMTITAVPIPGAVWLFGAAIVSLVGWRRK